jgi:hypothetical protein
MCRLIWNRPGGVSVIVSSSYVSISDTVVALQTVTTDDNEGECEWQSPAQCHPLRSLVFVCVCVMLQVTEVVGSTLELAHQ